MWSRFADKIQSDGTIKLGSLYEILEVKGAGSFGVVLHARHKGNNRKLALKISPTTTSSVLKEMNAL
jgi:serine/threonine protein kinase